MQENCSNCNINSHWLIRAKKRLLCEFQKISDNPLDDILVNFKEENILEWHFLFKGLKKTPFEGGEYHGVLTFPEKYPFSPPSIRFITPNGRFEVNERVCFALSDFHPECWKPAYTVSAVLQGVYSFMMSETMDTVGSLIRDENEIKQLAKKSTDFNKYDKLSTQLFIQTLENEGDSSKGIEIDRSAGQNPVFKFPESKLENNMQIRENRRIEEKARINYFSRKDEVDMEFNMDDIHENNGQSQNFQGEDTNCNHRSGKIGANFVSLENTKSSNKQGNTKTHEQKNDPMKQNGGCASSPSTEDQDTKVIPINQNHPTADIKYSYQNNHVDIAPNSPKQLTRTARNLQDGILTNPSKHQKIRLSPINQTHSSPNMTSFYLNSYEDTIAECPKQTTHTAAKSQDGYRSNVSKYKNTKIPPINQTHSSPSMTSSYPNSYEDTIAECPKQTTHTAAKSQDGYRSNVSKDKNTKIPPINQTHSSPSMTSSYLNSYEDTIAECPKQTTHTAAKSQDGYRSNVSKDKNTKIPPINQTHSSPNMTSSYPNSYEDAIIPLTTFSNSGNMSSFTDSTVMKTTGKYEQKTTDAANHQVESVHSASNDQESRMDLQNSTNRATYVMSHPDNIVTTTAGRSKQTTYTAAMQYKLPGSSLPSFPPNPVYDVEKESPSYANNPEDNIFNDLLRENSGSTFKPQDKFTPNSSKELHFQSFLPNQTSQKQPSNPAKYVIPNSNTTKQSNSPILSKYSDRYNYQHEDACINDKSMLFEQSIDTRHQPTNSTETGTEGFISDQLKEFGTKRYSDDLAFSDNTMNPQTGKLKYAKSSVAETQDTLTANSRLMDANSRKPVWNQIPSTSVVTHLNQFRFDTSINTNTQISTDSFSGRDGKSGHDFPKQIDSKGSLPNQVYTYDIPSSIYTGSRNKMSTISQMNSRTMSQHSEYKSSSPNIPNVKDGTSGYYSHALDSHYFPKSCNSFDKEKICPPKFPHLLYGSHINSGSSLDINSVEFHNKENTTKCLHDQSHKFSNNAINDPYNSLNDMKNLEISAVNLDVPSSQSSSYLFSRSDCSRFRENIPPYTTFETKDPKRMPNKQDGNSYSPESALNQFSETKANEKRYFDPNYNSLSLPTTKYPPERKSRSKLKSSKDFSKSHSNTENSMYSKTNITTSTSGPIYSTNSLPSDSNLNHDTKNNGSGKFCSDPTLARQRSKKRSSTFLESKSTTDCLSKQSETHSEISDVMQDNIAVSNLRKQQTDELITRIRNYSEKLLFEFKEVLEEIKSNGIENVSFPKHNL